MSEWQIINPYITNPSFNSRSSGLAKNPWRFYAFSYDLTDPFLRRDNSITFKNLDSVHLQERYHHSAKELWCSSFVFVKDSYVKNIMNVKHCPIETKPEMFNFFKSYDIYGVAHINHNACMQEKTPFTLIDLKNPGAVPWEVPRNYLHCLRSMISPSRPAFPGLPRMHTY